MKCNNCGEEFEGKFCTRCGAPAGYVPQPNMQQQTPPQMQQPQIQPQPGYQMPPNQQMYQQPPRKKKNGCLIAIIVVVCIIVFFTIIGTLVPDSDSSSETTETKETEEQKELTVGSSFEAGNLKITINDASTDFTEYDDEYGIYTPAEGMKYVMVDFTFENIGEEGDEYVSIYDFTCYADNSTCEQVYIDDGDFINTNLSPGRNVSFRTYYAVPVDSQSIELEYTALLEDSTEKIIIQ